MRPAAMKHASRFAATLSLILAPALAGAQGMILPRPCPRPTCQGGNQVVRTSSQVVAELRRLDPRTAPAHVYRVARWRRRERDFDYYA